MTHSRCAQVTVRLLLAATLAPITPSAAQSARAAGVWNGGASDEPVLRVRRYAPSFWIIRQGKRSSPEAPFMYLIAGRDSAMLLDTGAAPTDGTPLPLVALVDSLLSTVRTGRVWPLLVLHSHGHSDHRYLDAEFATRARTHVVPADTMALVAQLGLSGWPVEEPAMLDLGGRPLQVIPTPGHQNAHIMVYDERTGALLSGDMLYPGLLTVRDLNAFRASAERIERFAARHPIRHVLGAHVEMTDTPGQMYPLGTIVQSHEHALALPGTSVRRLADATGDAGDFVRELVRDDFILGRVQAPSADRPSTHGMLLFGRARVFVSHLPMSRTPHDYQLVFEADLPATALEQYRADATAHPAEFYTLEPASQWVLPNTISRDTTFLAHLYRGHFEKGGTRIVSDIPVRVRQLVMFRRFAPGDSVRPSAWFGVGRANERYLVHRVAGQGDVDQVVRLCADAHGGRDGASVVVATGTTMRAGAHTPVGTVCAVLYTERDDLEH